MKECGATHDKLAQILRSATDDGEGGGNTGLETRARLAGLAVVLRDELVYVGDGFLGGVAEHAVLLDEFFALLFVVGLGDGSAAGPDVFETLGGGEQTKDGAHVLVHLLFCLVGVELDGCAGRRAWGEERYGGDWAGRERWRGNLECAGGRGDRGNWDGVWDLSFPKVGRMRRTCGHFGVVGGRKGEGRREGGRRMKAR